MKLLLGIALLFLAAQLSEPACFFNAQSTRAPGECEDCNVCIDETDESVHEVGESWNATNCMVCSCRIGSYRCCDRAMRPVMFPEDCVAVLDHEACVYRVHLRDDPSIECPTYGAVGK
ncbi:beta-microseminoprotein-like [Leucoraja erinacea]|uniref:beta-microseminoprotein-like n=1 Tax=Leucoraja erinaceus TaxID=7782 RepID=UPI002455BEF3|nr:beta-microseminoprotein-like [Leucoraja erinacea]